MQLFTRGAPVRSTDEYRRILALARRAWEPSLAPRLTELLRTPRGTQTLRPLQAQGLYDLSVVGGLFGPMRVGSGKTLLTLLAPRILESRRPLLLLPAALIDKTRREQEILSRDWRVARHLRMLSYEMLGRESAQSELERFRPDLIIADECHRLKNPHAAVTRRVDRFMAKYPETRFAAMSGTIMAKSLKDFAHILAWCLKGHAPVPLERSDLEAWANALDDNVKGYQRAPAGVLGADLDSARQWFHARLVETPGVVASPKTQEYTGSLIIQTIEYEASDATDAKFKTLRTLWEATDGYPLSEAVAVWRHARELSLGLGYVWDPRAPDAWLDARRRWASFVRNFLCRSHTLDTELQVSRAVDRGEIRDDGALAHWRKVQPTFTINSKPQWHDDAALQLCENWMEKHVGICWVEHIFFAQELARRTGAPYFGSGGLDAKGRSIESASGSAIASIASCGTGRNLQKWHRNLLTTVPDPLRLEQLLGRTHREGQQADEVHVDVLLGCREHHEALVRAISAAHTQESMLGQEQKLLLADMNFPRDLVGRAGYRWKKTEKMENES